MSSSCWKITEKYDMFEERVCLSYKLRIMYRMQFGSYIELTPQEAIDMGSALMLWGEKELDSGRKIWDGEIK
jgi:hypothetical protein